MNKINMSKEITKEKVLAALSGIVEPGLGKSLTGSGLIRDVSVKGSTIQLVRVFLSPGYPGQSEIREEIENKIKNLGGVDKVNVKSILDVPYDGRIKESGLISIKNVIAVASGKGGVGKSTVSVNIAVSLAKNGANVGLLDADVYGPNIPMMMGVDRLPPQDTSKGKITPAEAYGVKMVSIGFMVRPEQPIVWRGPMLHSAIKQFIQDVEWGEVDYLVVDLPPGTGDAQLSLAQTVSITGGIIVTLPQQVSLEDARRGLEMFRQLDIPILGIVENMSYLELPDGQKMDIFGSGGGKKLAELTGVDFLGAIPIDSTIREGGDQGKPIVTSAPDSPAAKILSRIAAETALRTSLIALQNQAQGVPISIID
jgi:ATP-binding protein involved in chromosome partitioning